MAEFFKQPASAEEIAEARHQARNMFKVAGVLLALTILWAIIWSAPKLFVIGIGVFAALGVMKWLAADKAEKAMRSSATPTASAPAEPAAPTAPTDLPPQT